MLTIIISGCSPEVETKKNWGYEEITTTEYRLSLFVKPGGEKRQSCRSRSKSSKRRIQNCSEGIGTVPRSRSCPESGRGPFTSGRIKARNGRSCSRSGTSDVISNCLSKMSLVIALVKICMREAQSVLLQYLKWRDVKNGDLFAYSVPVM